MGNKKEIGKLVRDKMAGHRPVPDDEMWDNIASALEKKSDRRALPLWLKGALGVLAIALITGLFFLLPANTSPELQKETTNEILSDTDTTVSVRPTNESVIAATPKHTQAGAEKQATQQLTKAKSDNHSTASNNKPQKGNLSNPEEKTNKANTKNREKATYSTRKTTITSSSHSEEVVADNPTKRVDDSKKTHITSNNDDNLKSQSTSASTKNANTPDEKTEVTEIDKSAEDIEEVTTDEKTKTEVALEKSEEKNLEDVKNEKLKFTVSPYIAALSYGTLTKGSALDSRLVNNPQESLTTIGYGVQFEFQISERSSIRFGIGHTPLKYKTDGFEVSTSNGFNNIYNLDFLGPQDTSQSSTENSPAAISFFNENSIVSIQQELSYIDLPVTYQYALVKQKIGVAINPGFSVLILNDNEVYAIAKNDARLRLGEEARLNSLSFALNLGISAHYNINDHWRADVEPLFKYQLNPYSGNIADFRPYYLGLQFGLSYKF